MTYICQWKKTWCTAQLIKNLLQVRPQIYTSTSHDVYVLQINKRPDITLQQMQATLYIAEWAQTQS